MSSCRLTMGSETRSSISCEHSRSNVASALTVIGWLVNAKQIFEYGGDPVGRRVRIPNLLCRQKNLEADSISSRSPADSGIKPQHWTFIAWNGCTSWLVLDCSPRGYVERAGFPGNLLRCRPCFGIVARWSMHVRSWIGHAASTSGWTALTRPSPARRLSV